MCGPAPVKVAADESVFGGEKIQPWQERVKATASLAQSAHVALEFVCASSAEASPLSQPPPCLVSATKEQDARATLYSRPLPLSHDVVRRVVRPGALPEEGLPRSFSPEAE